MTLDKRVLKLLKTYMGKLFQKKVLTSMEEVEANTNETNLVSAPVIAELNNKLGAQPEWVKDATGKITGYRFGGADTVFPFNTNYRINCTIHLSGPGFNTTKSGYISVVDGKVTSSLQNAKKLFEVTDAGTQQYTAWLSIESIVII